MPEIRKITTSDNIALHVEIHGNPAGPAILFIHGSSQSIDVWRQQKESPLLQSYKLVMLDLRGHGRSDKPENFSYAQGDIFADDIKAVIDALHLKKPIICAWSFGTFILCDYIKKYGSNNLGGIQFIAPILVSGRQSPIGAKLDFTIFTNITCDHEATNLLGVSRFIKLLTHKKLAADQHYELFASMLRTPPHVRRALYSRELDHTMELPKITCPVQFQVGDQDAFMPVNLIKQYAEMIHGAGLVIHHNAGHSPFLEDTEFNNQLSQFIKNCEKNKNTLTSTEQNKFFRSRL